MLVNYFLELQQRISKKAKTSPAKEAKGKIKKTGTDKTAEKAAPSELIDVKLLKENLMGIIPSKLTVDDYRPVNSSGFSPEGSDLIIYHPQCRDISKIFDKQIPKELVYGTVHVVNKLDKKILMETLNKVIAVKKINYFTEEAEENKSGAIPAFVIAPETVYPLPELKNDIINYYLGSNIEHSYEFDILTILNRGIVIKNWREKRSFIALETGKDTMMWFYVLMNEYLDIDRSGSFDLRKYIRSDIVYPEY